jgi:lipid-A-disaccharide synthase
MPVYKIMLVAGEPSGDALGARLMAALRARTNGMVEFMGVGGEAMAAQGLASLFPISELSVMGLVEVLPRVPRLAARMRQTVAAAQAWRPDVVVTIDSPGFNFRLARRLRGLGAPLVHYVAPQVWAWRPRRARHLAGLYDRLLALLPFEPQWFEPVGVPTTFVGHPVIEVARPGDGPALRARLGIAPAAPLVAVLPGSRIGEIRRHLGVFGAALGLLRQQFPELCAVAPTLPVHADAIRAGTAKWSVKTHVLSALSDKYDAFAAAHVALAASGTVTLELALAKLPTVIAYKVNPVTGWLAKRLINVRRIGLVNILLDRPVMPELLQENCRPDTLAAALAALLSDAAARNLQRQVGETVAEMLGAGGEPPSYRAADAVLQEILAGKGQRLIGH